MNLTLVTFCVALISVIHVLFRRSQTGVYLLPFSIFIFLEIVLQFVVPNLLVSIESGPYLTKALSIYMVGFLFIFVGYYSSYFLLFRDKLIRSIEKILKYDFYDRYVPISVKILISIGIIFIFLVFYLTGIIPIFDEDMGQARLFHGDAAYFSYYKYIYWLGISLTALSLNILFISKLILRRLSFFYFYLIIGLVTLAFTLHRAPVLGVLMSMLIIYYQFNYQKLTFIKGFFLVSVFAYLVMVFAFYREGTGELNEYVIESLRSGSTFVDFYEFYLALKRFGTEQYIMGKTYIANFLGFIPYGNIDFRDTYRYKEWTKTLFGFGYEHGGLRLTVFAEPYFNFGIWGVILKSYLLGVAFSIYDSIIINAIRLYKNKGLGITGFLIVLAFCLFCVGMIQNSYDFLFHLSILFAYLFVLVFCHFVKTLFSFPRTALRNS